MAFPERNGRYTGMSSPLQQFNKMIANLLISKNLVPSDLVKSAYRQVGPTKDLAQVLLELGVINPKQAQQVRNYVQEQLRRRQAGADPVASEYATIPRPQPAAPAAPPQAAIPQPPPPQADPQPVPPPTAAPPQPAPPAAAQQPPRQAPPAAEAGAEAEPSLPYEYRESKGDGELTFPMPGNAHKDLSLEELLVFARKRGASDLHLIPKSPITMRLFNQLKRLGNEALTAEDVRRIVSRFLKPEQLAEFEETGDLELAFSIPGGGRYRMTLIRQRHGWDLTARAIPDRVLGVSQLGLPESCQDLTKWATGMVLVTGPLSCGKSTTLTTLVELVNRSRKDHIITIENPIEFIFTPAGCQLTQRQVDLHTLSQGNALRGALRQDPDIIVVSELRDLDTIRLAVTAAETGHLVFATMNTANATRTVNRLIDSFPPQEQEIIRVMISESLRGIISQQLVPRKDGRGVVAAFEVLIVTQAVSNMIRKNATHQLESAMVSGRQQGMVLLDNTLKDLVDRDIIEGVEAFRRASNPKRFLKYAPEELKGRYNA